MIRRILIAACLLLPVCAQAEIEKTALTSQGGTRLMWWPKLVPAEGWQRDVGASQANAINVLVPDGANFGNAETVIYGRAIYKPRDPGLKSLQALIERDQADFRKRSPDLEIREAEAAVAIADGTALRSFTYVPGAGARGNWEAVAYGEDGDYYLIFVMSSRSQKGYEAALASFRNMVASYTRER
jgi:hypothetical protein